MKIGRYMVDESNRKEGGQAFVFFSIDPDTGHDVAIKVARPSAWSRERMAREIKVQRRFDHPNILPILDHDPDLRWYVTTRASASLENLGPFPREDWTRLRVGLMGVASAIGYAHEKGYIHRDISPGNVLVFSAGWAVSDWGFVYEPPTRGAPRMTQHLERFGTPEFMAPEMVIEPRSAGRPADIYSIGRLAAWGTGLQRGESSPGDDATLSWWRQLIDSTTAWDAKDRWTMRDVETYLRAKLAPAHQSRTGTPAISEPGGGIVISDQRRRNLDLCPHCGSAMGGDATERCLDCHAMLGY